MRGAGRFASQGRPGIGTHRGTTLLTGFAANSVLCRLALGGGAIDAASFATLRLVSGAIALVLIASLTGRGPRAQRQGDPITAAMLFGYAVAFAFAY